MAAITNSVTGTSSSIGSDEWRDSSGIQPYTYPNVYYPPSTAPTQPQIQTQTWVPMPNPLASLEMQQIEDRLENIEHSLTTLLELLGVILEARQQQIKKEQQSESEKKV